MSSAGYAMGYVSGGVLLLINLAWILHPATFGFASTVSAIRASFVAVAVWWAVFSIPLFRKVPEPPAAAGGTAGSRSAPHSAGSAQTFSEIRRYRQRVPAVHRDAALPGRHPDRDPDVERLRRRSRHRSERADRRVRDGAVRRHPVRVPVRRAGHAASAPSAASSSPSASTSLATSLAYFMTSVVHFFLLAFLIATVLGGSQALSRALFSRMIPARSDVGVLWLLRRVRAIRDGLRPGAVHHQRDADRHRAGRPSSRSSACSSPARSC